MDVERDEILAPQQACAAGAGGATAMARLTRRGFMGIGQSSSEKSRFKSIESQSGRGTASLQKGTITT